MWCLPKRRRPSACSPASRSEQAVLIVRQRRVAVAGNPEASSEAPQLLAILATLGRLGPQLRDRVAQDAVNCAITGDGTRTRDVCSATRHTPSGMTGRRIDLNLHAAAWRYLTYRCHAGIVRSRGDLRLLYHLSAAPDGARRSRLGGSALRRRDRTAY